MANFKVAGIFTTNMEQLTNAGSCNVKFCFLVPLNRTSYYCHVEQPCLCGVGQENALLFYFKSKQLQAHLTETGGLESEITSIYDVNSVYGGVTA